MLAAKEFGKETARICTAREEVSVTAVGAGKRVLRLERVGDADGDGLLADAGMGRADDASL